METQDKNNPVVLIQCRRGSDLMTNGQSCDSKSAYNLSERPGGPIVTFKCVKCGFMWSTPVGGQVNFPQGV